MTESVERFWMDNLEYGDVVPMPKFPATVEEVVVPVTVRVPLMVVLSVMASPKVVSPSTLKVEAVVLDKVTLPTEVMEWVKRSPSASIRNLTEPPTDREKRFESEAADGGLTWRGASS